MSLLTRREALAQALALGVLSCTGKDALAMLAAFEEAEQRRPTPQAELGPFCKKGTPASSGVMRGPHDPGMPLKVSGRVFDVAGNSLEHATIEIWQTDHLGHYDLEGFRYRAKLLSSGNGGYNFDSVMPGHYPDRVCQHIHYLVTAPGHRPLVTQLYFATDPVFEGDPAKNFTRDRLITSIELVRPVVLAGNPKQMEASTSFDLVLERA
jgi:protocatechuate 3,4-dioxygenase beta subunit